VVAGNKRSVLMVESEAHELSEEVMLGAVMFGHREMQPVMDMIIEMAEACAKEPWDFKKQEESDLAARVRELSESDLRNAYKITSKQERSTTLDAIKKKVKAELVSEEITEKAIGAQLKKVEQ